ncbi:MAG: glycosyltransferase [Anaerolineae bacterium]|nr:glycosyltransferase [Anaerolineae bacterium]
MSESPLRILQLVSSMTIGGAEQIVLSLAERVDPRRFQTHVCSLSVIGDNSLQPEFERLHIPLLALNAGRFYDPAVVRAVRHYARQQRIDVIHTHLTDADVIGRLVGRALNIPVLSTMHNVPHNYDRQRRDRYWLERFTARYLATHLVAVSPKIREMFLSQWGISPERISAIYNSVRMEPFLAVPAGVPDVRWYPGPVITNVARLNPQKAQHLLLEAAPAVLQSYPQATFLLVGKGHLEQELRQQVQALGISQHVVFTGVRHDIPDILAQTDIFVLPSRWEGLPLSAIEAMAAARPVLVTDVGGNSELVESGRSGVVIPAADVEALTDGLLALLADEAARLALGAAARQRVQLLFSMERFIQQYEAVYTQLGLHLPISQSQLLQEVTV